MSNREIHGALKDAKLLASVYLELTGGRQAKLEFENKNDNFVDLEKNNNVEINEHYKNIPLKKINNVKLDDSDYKMHLMSIEKIKNSIWKKING